MFLYFYCFSLFPEKTLGKNQISCCRWNGSFYYNNSFPDLQSKSFTDLVGSGKGTEDELIWSDEPSYTLKNLICNPGHSAKMLLGTFVGFFGTFFGDMISGGFGWLQISSSPVIVSCCFAILLGLALSESNQTIVMSKNKELLQEWQ